MSRFASHARLQRGGLALVHSATELEVARDIYFCGHCARHFVEPPSGSRVCGDCGLGLIVQSAAQDAPAPAGAFVILDRTLAVSALSAAGEELLAVAETAAINRHVTDLLVPAAAEGGRNGLASAVAEIMSGAIERTDVFVRPARTFGVRIRTRIALCYPGPAALLVLT